tara:strand:- start:263 stop:478 length:216 start_codon:yes stop_codon:yes gene_type:complete
MNLSRKVVALSMGLGILSAISILVAHLALTDIYHGEGDLALEWRVLLAAFGTIIAFHLVTLTTMGRAVLKR